MLSLYEILKASKTGIAPDMWTALAGANYGGAGSGAETKEITGIPPLSFRADGTPLLDYLISGNMQQASGVSPTTPIQPQETGERTGNLFDKNSTNTNNGYIPDGYLKSDGSKNANGDYRASEYISVNASTVYMLYCVVALNAPSVCFYDSDKNFISGVPYSGRVTIPFTTPQDAAFLRLSYRAIDEDAIMLNTGSTPLLYEPYGYKIPISSGGENLFPQNSFIGKSTVVQTAFNEIGSSIAFNNGQYVLSMNVTTEATTGIFKVCFTYTDGSQDQSQWITYRTPSIVLISNGTKVVKSISITDYNNYIDIAFSNIMLNLGSEPLPYSPYNRTTTPVYLGEVQTTRRIKKLVLTGDEIWGRVDNCFRLSLPNSSNTVGTIISTHFEYKIPWALINTASVGACVSTTYYGTAYKFLMIRCDDIATTAADFKSYLAAQYAAGTPVCVWYVLAEPTTGIVNEPLRKIGDYADTVSYEQSGVQIPTNKGNTVIDVETTLKPSEMYIKYQE